MKVQNKLHILILCLIVIGLMVGCGSIQNANNNSSTQGFGIEEEVPAEEVPAEEVPAEEVPSEEEMPDEEMPSEEMPSEEMPSEEMPSEEENINVAYAFDVVVAWPVANSDLTVLPENPVLVTMADSVMTVETECYMFSGRYSANPRLSISPLAQIEESCDNISAEEQALVDTLPKAHSFMFRDDTSVELAYGDGLIIVLEAQESYNTSAETEIREAPAAASESD